MAYNSKYFPDPTQTTEDGLLAIDLPLTQEILLDAYQCGVFPWYSPGMPTLWWSPDPRFVLYPHKLKISKSLSQTIRSQKYSVTWNKAFESVMRFCAYTPRKGEDGTWITPEMIEAYVGLHHQGFAHSVEVRLAQQLVGGLYGIAIGGVFFGESMFHHQRDASKIALVALTEKLKDAGFHFIDAQIPTEHLKSLGAEEIPRSQFLKELEKGIASAPSIDWMAD